MISVLYQETSAVTNCFTHPSKDYVNFISTDSPVQMMSTQNNSQKSGRLRHSHKKRKDSLEGSLDRVLFAAELDFPKILVPRLLQNSSNVNIECARKSKQTYI